MPWLEFCYEKSPAHSVQPAAYRQTKLTVFYSASCIDGHIFGFKILSKKVDLIQNQKTYFGIQLFVW